MASAKNNASNLPIIAIALIAVVIIVALIYFAMPHYTPPSRTAPQNTTSTSTTTPANATSQQFSNSTVPQCGSGNYCMSKAELISLAGNNPAAVLNYHATYSSFTSYASDPNPNNVTGTLTVWAAFVPNAIKSRSQAYYQYNQYQSIISQPTEQIYFTANPERFYSSYVAPISSGLTAFSGSNVSSSYMISNGTVSGLTYTYVLNKDIIFNSSDSELIGYKGNTMVIFSYFGKPILNESALATTISKDIP